MNTDEFSRKLVTVFGSQNGALKTASEKLVINYDNLRKMASGKRGVPDWVALKLNELEALAVIPSAPDVLDAETRSVQCRDAISPKFFDLVAQAEKSGWEKPEIFAAVISLVNKG